MNHIGETVNDKEKKRKEKKRKEEKRIESKTRNELNIRKALEDI